MSEFSSEIFHKIVPDEIAIKYEPLKKLHGRKENYVFTAKEKETGNIVVFKASKIFTKEKEIFERLPKDAPHILRPLKQFKRKDKKKDDSSSIDLEIYIFPYCEKGDLFEYIAKNTWLPESISRYFFKQICDGVKVLHDNNIIHRDIKSENILIDKDNNIYISDFELADIIPKGKNIIMDRRVFGSIDYAPPEVKHGVKNKYYITYSKAIDIWLLGELLFGMLTGYKLHKPFNYNCNWKILKSRIAQKHVLNKESRKRMRYEDPFREDCSNELSKEVEYVMRSIIKIHPSLRPSINDIIEYPWFEKKFKEIKFENYEEKVK